MTLPFPPRPGHSSQIAFYLLAAYVPSSKSHRFAALTDIFHVALGMTHGDVGVSSAATSTEPKEKNRIEVGGYRLCLSVMWSFYL